MKLQELINFTYFYNNIDTIFTISTTIIGLLKGNGLHSYHRMFTSSNNDLFWPNLRSFIVNQNWHGHILRRNIKKRLK